MRYVNMDQSKSLSQFTQQQSKSLRNRLSTYPEKYDLNIQVSPEQKRGGLIAVFKVSGRIHIAGKKQLRAVKTGSNVKKLIAQVVDVLERQMRRLTRKEVRSRYTFGRSLTPVRDFKRNHENLLQSA